MTERDGDKSENGGSVAEREARLARARLAFDHGLREASEQGVRAARRLLVPALWGAALVGGALLAVSLVRMLRRPRADRALLRIAIEPRIDARQLLPALGSALARLALQRLLATASAESPGVLPAHGTKGTVAPETSPLTAGPSNGLARA